jgi:hypothetical protein
MLERDGPAISALWYAIAEVKQRWSVIGWVTKVLLSRALPLFGMLVKSLVPHLQSLAPTNPHWPRVVAPRCGPSSGDINRLMMMMTMMMKLSVR